MGWPIQIRFARELRKNQTPEEKIIWQLLRNRKFYELKFLRQHPIIFREINGQKGFYIADFYCAEKKLVVEIDGEIHNYQIDYDKARDIMMNELKLKVIRIRNKEVATDINSVLIKLRSAL